jgi:hypothetical protein
MAVTIDGYSGVQLVAAVAPRGYMLLCLLHWDARPIRGRIADGGRCRASMPGLILPWH